jgi:PAS domain S-box-containing protein
MAHDDQSSHGRLEQDLRASELSYRRLFEAAQDGILILDVATGRVDDVNPFLLNLLGFSRHEMVGKTVGELSPFKDVVSNQAMLERLQHDGYVRYDMMHALKRINPKVRIVASSGVNYNRDMSEVHNPTGRDFLVKPYTAKTLLTAIRTVLDEA